MLTIFGNLLLRGKSDASLKDENDAASDLSTKINSAERDLPTSTDAYSRNWSGLLTRPVAGGNSFEGHNDAGFSASANTTPVTTFLGGEGEADTAANSLQPSPGGLFGMPDGVTATSGNSGPGFDGLILQFHAGASAAEKASAIASIHGKVKDRIRADNGSTGELVVIDIGQQLPEKAIQALAHSPGVQFAEPNWLLGAQATPNDAYYTGGNMWGMYGDGTSPSNAYGSQAGEAWAADYMGKTNTVVGDIDTGIDYTHPDLYLNVWLNQAELPSSMGLQDTDGDGLITFRDLNNSANAAFVKDLNANGRIDAGDLLSDKNWADGIDNDLNGYTDDLIGWDFVNNDNNPYDDNNHGTHTAGTIGAMGGNTVGVVGVNWNVEIMGLKFLSASGSGSIANAVKALDYYTAAAAQDQAKGWTSEFLGTNNSWGGGGYSQAMQDSITRSALRDLLFIAAAGNGGSDGIGDNNDKVANYPSNYSTLTSAGFESVIAVAALMSNGSLASFSNYGAQTVDLAAPGYGVMSTIPNGGYASYSGTSMATPHVTGALALEASLHPEYSALQLRDALLASTSFTAALVGKSYTWGRLDVGVLTGLSPQTNIVGSTIYGLAGSDAKTGTDYNDTIYGVPQTGANIGKGTVDTLTGGAGYDLFILGDSRGIFYNDGNNTVAGTSDYALIKDFTAQDFIQLKQSNYWTANANIGGQTGVGIYADTNSNKRFDTSDELIGLVQGAASSSILTSSSKFVFV